MSKRGLRKEAYRYIQAILSKLPIGASDVDLVLVISLEELRQLKEGVADPSASLVASLKKLLRGTVTEAEIEAYLVLPFTEYGRRSGQ
jgi:hypothetical protein